MDIERVVADLNRRFAQELPEFYKRRIIFWNDPDRAFEDVVGTLQLINAKIVVLTGKNNFAVKKLLAIDDKTSNYLLYNPFTYAENQEDNWLLNFELYSEEFYADLNSMWMDEMGLPSSQALRSQVKQYNKFFKSKERRAKVAALSKNIVNVSQMHLAVMAAICNLKDMGPDSIIRAVLSAGLDENNSIYNEFISYGADKAFWMLISRATGYSKDTPKLSELAAHILLTATTRSILPEKLSGLGDYISVPHQAFCYEFIEQWLHSDRNHSLYDITRKVEDELRLMRRFRSMNIEDVDDAETFPCIDEAILLRLLADIQEDAAIPEQIKTIVVKRRHGAWFPKFECYYEAVYQVAQMYAFYHDYIAGFHEILPIELWKKYTSEYYKMDAYYRQFHLYYNRCLKDSNPMLDDCIKHTVEKVEGFYNVWFLGELSSNWNDLCASDFKDYGYIRGIERQTEFYSRRVKNADTRTFVIISDAMRYAVGAELAEALRRDTQGKVELASCQSVFPSITKFGMAALLPHKKLSVVDKGTGAVSVLADGQSTESQNRDKLLKAANPNSTALKYKDIIDMRRAERQELVKGMDVVYIYHDKIDETSHVNERLVFDACDEAIEEIKNLIRIICNEFGGTHILITADHGFLYTYSPLTETDKVDKASFGGLEVEYARRYAIMKSGANPDYLQPIKLLDGEEYVGFAPRENTRIKVNGGGMNFVHGGTSLQEMVVPIVDYHFLRNSNKTYLHNRDKFDTKPVTVDLLSANRKICNMIFALNFYQKEPVTDIRTAATYLLYFTDAMGVQVSDTVKLIADKDNQNEQERTYRCNFNLKPMQFDKNAKYYLVISDETGLQADKKIEFRIDIAFSVGEFDFFS